MPDSFVWTDKAVSAPRWLSYVTRRVGALIGNRLSADLPRLVSAPRPAGSPTYVRPRGISLASDGISLRDFDRVT